MDEHHSDRYCKKFYTWDHLVMMLMLQLSGASSLNDLQVIQAANPNTLYHLNTKRIPKSTLADANSNRDFSVFSDIAKYMIASMNNRKLHKNSKDIITILDSTTFDLRGFGHEWAKETATRNAGLKLHTKYLPDAEEIEAFTITDTNVNDICAAKAMGVDPSRIYVFDKGYCDYNWWNEIDKANSIFVTRLKLNAAYKVLESKSVPSKAEVTILRDESITLTNKQPRGKKTNLLAGKKLRLITLPHPHDSSKEFPIVSNDLVSPAEAIANLYKQRWEIELFFKWSKQNLKIKKFIGQSRNAICIQILTAIIAYVLIGLFCKKQNFNGRQKDALLTIKIQLFSSPELLLQKEKRRKTTESKDIQLEFSFNNPLNVGY